MCKVCSSLGQKWGNERAITGSKIILTCPLLIGTELKLQMLDSRNDVLRTNKLEKVTKMVLCYWP